MLRSNLDRRTPLKQRRILAELRREIIEGRVAVGSRLPTHMELSERFGVSNVTIQRAMDRLVHEGFVTARGRMGTFVTDRPPHLSHYGLIFPTHPDYDERWQTARFWNALVHEAGRVSGSRGVSIYRGINGRAEGVDHRRLAEDLSSHRLAGVMLVVPHETVRAPLLAEASTPRVGIGSNGGEAGLDVTCMEEMHDKALDYLASRGRRRVAVVGSGEPRQDWIDRFAQLITNRGMSTHPLWINGVAPSHGLGARNLVRLLMDRPASEKPDALYVTDDTLLEHATGGLVDAGVRVPEDLEVVGHCNFPWPTPSVVPVRRLGYDVRRVLATALEQIDRRRLQPGAPASMQIVPAQFEHEVQIPMSVSTREAIPAVSMAS